MHMQANILTNSKRCVHAHEIGRSGLALGPFSYARAPQEVKVGGCRWVGVRGWVKVGEYRWVRIGGWVGGKVAVQI